MYICICNALTDKQVRTVLGDEECSTAKVYARLGCAPQCGKCVPEVRTMVRQSRADAANGDAMAETPMIAAE